LRGFRSPVACQSMAECTEYGHNGHMRKASLAEAKAHLSELVDRAEHHKRPTLIVRHGKPAAVLVPVESVGRERARAMTDEEANLFMNEIAKDGGDPSFDAVADLVAGRR
jgi:prevent-host-death family protein